MILGSEARNLNRYRDLVVFLQMHRLILAQLAKVVLELLLYALLQHEVVVVGYLVILMLGPHGGVRVPSVHVLHARTRHLPI